MGQDDDWIVSNESRATSRETEDDRKCLREIVSEGCLMDATVVPLEGKAWQSWADELLVAHYGPTEYHKFPDTMGDGGIEGFTSCGRAYQAYGADRTKTGQSLYESQRDKMTEDVNKFIDNRRKLTKLFGDAKIKRWVLFVPKVGLKDLQAHANKMTKKVVAANLPYVDDDFEVAYCDEDSFATERSKIAVFKNRGIRLNAPTPNVVELDEWEADNRPLMEKVQDKIERLEPEANPERRSLIQRNLLSWHLQGQMLMSKLNSLSPAIYEEVFEAKSLYEQQLWFHDLTEVDAKQHLSDVMAGFRHSLDQAVLAIDDSTVQALASAAIADWMLRCPLDFKDA